jgi:integrase
MEVMAEAISNSHVLVRENEAKLTEAGFSPRAGEPGGRHGSAIQWISDFRKTWAKACKEAEVPSLLFHDLRRSGARNLRNAGVAEGVIMKIGGWKTRSVFERYAIVSDSDIRHAMTSLEGEAAAG